MAVLTEAIEAEGEAEAVIAIGVVLVVTVMAAIITEEAAGLVHVLGPRSTTATIVHRAAHVETRETMTGAIAGTEMPVDAAQPLKVAVKHLNLLKTSVTDVQSSCSSLLHG